MPAEEAFPTEIQMCTNNNERKFILAFLSVQEKPVINIFSLFRNGRGRAQLSLRAAVQRIPRRDRLELYRAGCGYHEPRDADAGQTFLFSILK